MTSKRRRKCSLCDGAGVDKAGDCCVECRGLGATEYGLDRGRAEIEKDLESTLRTLGEDRDELARAERGLSTAPPERRGAIVKQISMIEDAVKYWEHQIRGLETELADCDRRWSEAEQKADAKAYGDHAAQEG